MINATDWYWIVGDSTSQVYSSKRNAYVPLTDADYAAWLDVSGNHPNTILNEAELWVVLQQRGVILPDWMFNGTSFVQSSADAYTKAQLAAYAASMRYNKEVAGTTVNGVPYLSDRETQSKLASAVLFGQVNPQITFEWKAADGTFVTLDATAMTNVAETVALYVQNCFAKEATVKAGIDAGTITTPAQVDAAFAA